VSLTCVWRRVSLELSALMWPCGTLQQGTNLEFSGDSRGLMGMGVVHESQMPTFTPSFTDPISAHIPLKIKEKIWAGGICSILCSGTDRRHGDIILHARL
jgi:hypothetical protein